MGNVLRTQRSPTARRALALVLTFAIGLAAGCGSKTTKEPSESPRRIVERFVAAIGMDGPDSANDLVPDAAVIAAAVPDSPDDLALRVKVIRTKALQTLGAIRHDLLYAKATAADIVISAVEWGLSEGENTGILGARIEATLKYGETTRIVKLFTYDLGGRFWIFGPIEWAALPE